MPIPHTRSINRPGRGTERNRRNTRSRAERRAEGTTVVAPLREAGTTTGQAQEGGDSSGVSTVALGYVTAAGADVDDVLGDVLDDVDAVDEAGSS
ncbi:hypothetical protein SAFG77S_00707 [Streptomyces afghaniensis]